MASETMTTPSPPTSRPQPVRLWTVNPTAERPITTPRPTSTHLQSFEPRSERVRGGVWGVSLPSLDETARLPPRAGVYPRTQGSEAAVITAAATITPRAADGYRLAMHQGSHWAQWTGVPLASPERQSSMRCYEVGSVRHELALAEGQLWQCAHNRWFLTH